MTRHFTIVLSIVTVVAVLAAAGVVTARVTKKWLTKRVDRAIEMAVTAKVQPLASALEATSAEVAKLAADLQESERSREATSAEVLAADPREGEGLMETGGLGQFPGEYRGSSVPVFGLFDAAGLYRKNGLVELYGADLRERRSGPIMVTEADLEIKQEDAWLLWSPDFSPAADATHLQVTFTAVPTAGRFTVGFIFKDGQSYAFSYEFGPSARAAPAGPSPLPQEDIALKTLATRNPANFKVSGNRLIAALPPTLLTKLQKEGGDAQIVQWFVRVTGAAATTVRFAQVALVRAAPPATASGVRLSGHVRGGNLPPNAVIELLREDGHVVSRALSLDGRFAFVGLSPDRPVSLRLRSPVLMHFATLGRWFVPGYSRSDMVIDLQPRYVNEDGHAPDPKTAKLVGPRVPSPFSAQYESHTRQYWPGAGKYQEFDSTTFTNNMGFLDRDRFFDNPDDCLRIASLGASDLVALQVKPVDRYNILMEEDIGITLGKCVEVISAGTDNGDIGANYPRLRDYVSKFGTKFTLISSPAALVFQLQPQMLKDGLGLDHENSSIPNFYFDEGGKLAFRMPSPVYPVFTSQPTYPEYTKGIPFADTLQVPFEFMPQQGKDVFRYLTAIIDYIGQHHPDQHLVLHTGVDQAQCRRNCQTTLTLGSGQSVAAGAKIYVRNLTEYCDQNHYLCINPEFSEIFGEDGNELTFKYDSHYSPLGHQWIAEQLSSGIVQTLHAH
jgi:hypothetical protein